MHRFTFLNLHEITALTAAFTNKICFRCSSNLISLVRMSSSCFPLKHPSLWNGGRRLLNLVRSLSQRMNNGLPEFR